MRAGTFIAGTAALAAAIVATGLTVTGRGEAALYLDPEVVAEGKALYSQHCADCHGAALEGEPDWMDRDADGYLPAPPHDETGHTWHHPTEQLLEITREGTEAVVGNGYRSRMAGFGDRLTDEQIHAILAYIKSTWPRRIIERHDRMDAAAD